MPPNPDINNIYSLIGFSLLIAFHLFQSWQNNRIKAQGNVIEKQTNGLVGAAVKSATDAGHAAGELAGTTKEQIRAAAVLVLADEVEAAKLVLSNEVAAAKLALSNEVAAHLAAIKGTKP